MLECLTLYFINPLAHVLPSCGSLLVNALQSQVLKLDGVEKEMQAKEESLNLNRCFHSLNKSVGPHNHSVTRYWRLKVQERGKPQGRQGYVAVLAQQCDPAC